MPIDLSTEPSEHADELELANRALANAAMERIQGWKGAEVAVSSFGQAQMCLAVFNGLVQLMLHKGTFTQSDLNDAMAWAARERAAQLNQQAKKSSLILPDAPRARHRNS
jgi:hypothetical protein